MSADNQSPNLPCGSDANRLLEDTGILTIAISGLVLGTATGFLSARRLYTVDGLTWRMYSSWTLNWSPAASLGLLSGKTVTDLLGAHYILLRGSHRPAYHPVPGVDSATIAEVWMNPEELDASELFQRIYNVPIV